ncbi:MAG: hypothetical protein JSR61_21340 [Proteobacteria bacterium]|nr:hypothetical protein [Pseudomonadota bacterium]
MDMAIRAFYQVPVVGWLAKDAARGKPDARYYFFFNIVILYAVTVYIVGYPLLIVTALTATALLLTSIVALTATDMIENRVRRLRAGVRRSA